MPYRVTAPPVAFVPYRALTLPSQDSGATAAAPTSWGDIVEQEERDEREQVSHAATHEDVPMKLYKAEEHELAGH